MLYKLGKEFSKNFKPIGIIKRQAVAVPHIDEILLKSEPSTEVSSPAKSYESIPGPSRIQLLRGFIPGGRFHNKSILDFNTILRKDYGDIFVIPGIFGKNDMLFTFNPEDFQKVFRTEGVHPIRRGLDTIKLYRDTYRREIFDKATGLITEQGEGWTHFRSIVNPVLLNPKALHFYAPRMNNVVDELIKRIRNRRDPLTLETPADFGRDVNHLSMDFVCLVALDTQLNMIGNSEAQPRAVGVIDGMRVLLPLLLELDLQPSLWKIIATPKFKRIIELLDNMISLTVYYVDQALERIKQEEASGIVKLESERSILERLLKIDRAVAIIMAIDMLQAGVDTTSSGFVGCFLALAKNPEKQEILRQEIRKILPNKDTPITADKLKHLPYLRAYIKEAMRIYPVATGNFRSTGQELVLSGYHVPKNLDVFMCSQKLLTDERFFRRPKEFLPERWLRGDASNDSDGCPLNYNEPFVFLPFGFGPRSCVGKRLVDLEFEITMAKLVRNFEIRYDYDTSDLYITHIINVPGKPLHFKFIDIEN